MLNSNTFLKLLAQKSMILQQSDTKSVLSCSDKGHPLSLFKGEYPIRPKESPTSVYRLYSIAYAYCKHKRICIGFTYIILKVVIIVSLVYVYTHRKDDLYRIN